MKKDSFLNRAANLAIVFIVFALVYALFSGWVDKVKDPKTRTVTLITTVLTAIAMILILTNQEAVRAFIKE
jgi:Na+-driven multidrug efflux pump